jgi:hypothetical protein
MHVDKQPHISGYTKLVIIIDHNVGKEGGNIQHYLIKFLECFVEDIFRGGVFIFGRFQFIPRFGKQ